MFCFFSFVHLHMRSQLARDILKKTVKALSKVGAAEAQAIALMLVENIFNLEQNEIIINRPINPTEQQLKQLEDYTAEILLGKPVQYVLGYAYFHDHKFKVNRSTLIPRQETEQLVELVLDEIHMKEQPKVLDIGTGSGCIAISVALADKKAKVSAMDVSEDALQVAVLNNSLLASGVNFFVGDIFSFQPNEKYDIIVSNPPYVLESERKLMARNILDYEPPMALFVPDTEPLLFYKEIVDRTHNALVSGGAVFFEINEKMGAGMIKLLKEYGFTEIEIIKDINNKDRFARGINS